MGPGAEALAAFGFPPLGSHADRTAPFQDFAQLLTLLAEAQGRDLQDTDTVTDACMLLIEWLQAQVAGLQSSVLPALDPYLDWLETQTQPVLGIGRETHARWSALARAGIAHGKALRALHALHLEVLQTALGRCRDALGQDDGEVIDSLYGLSGWWAGIVDDTYRERALEADYARSFADWVNSASALRRGWLAWQAGQAGMIGPWFNPMPSSRA